MRGCEFVHPGRKSKTAAGTFEQLIIQKLEQATDDEVVFEKRLKKLRKNAKHGEDCYRGSRFWGVSKNKSKWQVMITLNHYKEYNGGFS